MSNNFQKHTDRLLSLTILRFIPNSIKPNFFSYIRIASVPFIYLLLTYQFYLIGTILFLLSALTDAIDGALARTRGQITDLGILLDPIADKMLIVTILIFLGFEYFVVKVFVIVILFETVGVLSQALFAKYLGRPIKANLFGKIKMLLQSLTVFLFLIGLLSKNNQLILTSEYILIIALFFALISSLEQLRRASVRFFKDKVAIVD